MLEAYNKHVDERAEKNIPPKPLTAEQTQELITLLTSKTCEDKNALVELLAHRVPPGVDPAAKIKADFLYQQIKEENPASIIAPQQAIELLGTMQGGYNVQPLIHLLDDPRWASSAAEQLSATLLIFEKFKDVEEKAKQGNAWAQKVIHSWADAEWFLRRPALPEKITLKVFKVTGETNTDDLSPAPEAWSRPDIPLHALSMLCHPRDGVSPDEPGSRGPIRQLEQLKKEGYPLVYVGDVVGTGSS